MNPIDIRFIKSGLWNTNNTRRECNLGKWRYYYFKGKTYSKRKFAYLPTNTISGWIWFKHYYQWYNFISSHKGIDVFSSIRTLNDIERIEIVDELRIDHVKYLYQFLIRCSNS
jgi:hypothetical protein